jgi:hypothetical protein
MVVVFHARYFARCSEQVGRRHFAHETTLFFSFTSFSRLSCILSSQTENAGNAIENARFRMRLRYSLKRLHPRSCSKEYAGPVSAAARMIVICGLPTMYLSLGQCAISQPPMAPTL